MNTSFKQILAFTTFTFIFSSTITAQLEKGNFINASIGYGLSLPYDDLDVPSRGFYIQGEYVHNVTKWIGVRPYAGFISTSTDQDELAYELQGSYVKANAFLLGGKIRIAAPIPYVAPFAEIGVGASIGSFETVTPLTNKSKNGVSIHIPFTLGLALGRKNNVDVALVYYFHTLAEQYSGAAAIGLSFPLNSK